jgi:TonB family protein
LPRQISLTIDALIAHAADGRITADPALPLNVSYEDSAGGRALHGQCAVNGGGEVLHLRTTAGNIRLRFLDASMERQLAQLRAEEMKPPALNSGEATKASVNGASSGATGQGDDAAQDRDRNSARNASRPWWHGSWWQDFWWGGVRVDPHEEQKRLSHAVAPEYPDAARQAGIEGDVTMRVVVGPDGAVNGLKLLSGDPALARAAMESVAQWRYAPALLDGWPVSVVTTVTVAFRLH